MGATFFPIAQIECYYEIYNSSTNIHAIHFLWSTPHTVCRLKHKIKYYLFDIPAKHWLLRSYTKVPGQLALKALPLPYATNIPITEYNSPFPSLNLFSILHKPSFLRESSLSVSYEKQKKQRQSNSNNSIQ